MTIVLRVILILACAMTCLYTLRKIRKSQMQIEDSLFWIAISFGLLLISIFPELANFFSGIFGVGATVNFIFLVMIFILLLKVFMMSLKMSQMEDKIKKLVQRITIINQEEEELLEELSAGIETGKEKQSKDC